MNETDKWDMNLEDLMNHEYQHDSWIQDIIITIKNDQQQHKNITLSECEIWNDCLYYRDLMIVLNSESLCFKILEFAHDAAIAEHSEWVKIYEIVQQSYYWPMMHDFV